MRILLTSIWALSLMNCLLEVSGSQNYKVIPLDPSSGCQMLLNADQYVIAGKNCTSVPLNYPINGTDLQIKATNIGALEVGNLDHYTQLKSLTVEMNTILVKISPGVFGGMENLINLTISNNVLLQYVDPDTFKGLTRLENLVLFKNGFTEFYCISIAARPAILPRLVSLDISDNSFGTILYSDAHNLENSSIQSLKLTNCAITDVDGYAFNKLPFLRTLYIDSNYLKDQTVIDLIANISISSVNFTELYVGSNYFDELDVFLNALSSTKVSLVDSSYTHFADTLPQNVPPLPSVVYFSCNGCFASSKACQYFTPNQFPNLEYLYLGKNLLLDTHFSMSLPKLRVLDLSDNFRSSGYLPIFVQDSFTLEGLPSLENLILTNNPIGSVKQSYFQGLVELKQLNLSNASINELESDSFASLEYLEVLDLSNNPLSVPFTINNRTFTGLKGLRILHLDRCSITCLRDDNTFIHTPELQVLTLNLNSLLELHHLLLSPLPHLYHLDLGKNAFQNWDRPLFTNNTELGELDISENRISAFSSAMLQDFARLHWIDFTDNALSCACSDISALFVYVNSSGETALMEALRRSQPLCSSPISARFTPFLDTVKAMSAEGDCTISDETHSFIKFVVLGICVMILIGGPSLYFLRWHIKYWMFLIRQAMSCYIFPKRKIPEPHGEYAYDAFVSYSNEDRGFVVRLASMLESHAPHFRLCIFERDFCVGGIITDNVVECLTKSRRTILILSDSFAKSTWCQWEMSLAQHKRLFFKDAHHGPLIIVKIGEIMEKHMTPTLRHLIRTRIYLQWNADPIKQKVFWQKLRTALAAPLEKDTRSSLQHSMLSSGETVNNNNVGMSSLYHNNQPLEV